MSIDSTNPATQIGDRAGNAATLDKDGIRTFQEVRDTGVYELLLKVLDRLDAIETAIQELDNI